MAWTTPGTAVAGSVLTAAFWNLHVRDNLNAINTPEIVSANGTATQAGSLSADMTYNSASITLTSGSWLVVAGVSATTSVADAVACGIWDNTGSALVAGSTGNPVTAAGGAAAVAVTSIPTQITVTSSTVYRPRLRRNGSSTPTVPATAAGGASGYITALRLSY